jgi:Type II secretion system protein C
MDRIARVLYVGALVLLLAALVFQLVPAPVGAAPARVRAVAQSAKVQQRNAGLPGSSAAIVQGNVFAPSRSAPSPRYVPPDLVSAGEPEQPTRRRVATTRLRLFGTVLGPSGPAALIDADPAVRGAEIYQVGDTVDGRRIVAVSESTVVLDGAGGRMVLRLLPDRQSTR